MFFRLFLSPYICLLNNYEQAKKQTKVCKALSSDCICCFLVLKNTHERLRVPKVRFIGRSPASFFVRRQVRFIEKSTCFAQLPYEKLGSFIRLSASDSATQ